MSFKEKCEMLNIDYKFASSFKRMHPELTDNEVLSYYIPNSTVNWDDDLIIDGKIIDFDE